MGNALKDACLRTPLARIEARMIVVTRNGKTTVVTGWRAWLVGVVVFVAAMALLLVIAFVILGMAITVGAVLLIVVPVAVGVALLASLFRSPRT